VALVTRPAPASVLDAPPLALLTAQELAVYQVLARNAGRVLSRPEIAREAGIDELSERRCDSLIVGIRRRIGSEQIVTVRRRGWMLVGGDLR
jgi:DNA-binding response OmpR family regulator